MSRTILLPCSSITAIASLCGRPVHSVGAPMRTVLYDVGSSAVKGPDAHGPPSASVRRHVGNNEQRIAGPVHCRTEGSRFPNISYGRVLSSSCHDRHSKGAASIRAATHRFAEFLHIDNQWPEGNNRLIAARWACPCSTH